MNKLVNALTNLTTTENGALTLKNTGHSVLDFFSKSGSLRNSNLNVIELFENALKENPELALKALFYSRDCRGGQGERNLFRTLIKWLAASPKYYKYVKSNIDNIAKFGRYDDLYVLFDTPIEKDVLEYISKEIEKDVVALGEDSNAKVSLLAKWLPSSNTSSAVTRSYARKIYKALGLSEKEYRKMLSHIRAQLKVVEKDMSAKNFSEIDYSGVPSRAAMIYRNAFKNRDGVRYGEFLEDVASGKKTIKSSTLYPYEIVEKFMNGYGADATLEAQWSALPDYLKDNPHNAIVVADVSASMSGRPMTIAISLAIYLAERTKGAFKDYFITFHETPQMLQLKGSNLQEKVKNVQKAPWGGSTNLQSVFDLILNRGVQYKVPQSEMPDVIYIPSDMEFNQACRSNNKTNLEVIREKYEKAGYVMPKLVFWNCDARGENSPAMYNEDGVFLVSGASPSIFKTALTQEIKTPVDLMLDILNSERYESVRV